MELIEPTYNISAIYLQVKENKEPVSAIPAPTGIYGSEIIVDGIKWDRTSDMTVCSGELEIASSASGGYMEITFAGSRDRRDTWQHYRDIMAENMQAALVERDRVRLMARILRASPRTTNRIAPLHWLNPANHSLPIQSMPSMPVILWAEACVI